MDRWKWRAIAAASTLMIAFAGTACTANPESDGRAASQQRQKYSEGFTVFGKTAAQTFSEPENVALAHAACRGDLSAIANLVARGANPNALSKDRSVSMLAWSMECQGVAGFEALLKAKADPNVRLIRIGDGGAPYGLNMVTFAAGIALPDYLRLLLKYGGDPSSRVTGGNALSESVYLGPLDNYTNFQILLDAGADVNVNVGIERSVAMQVALINRWDKVAELLDRGYHRRLDVLAWYLQRDNFLKSDPSKTTDDGRSQMQWAAKVKVILEARGIKFPVADDPPSEQADLDAEEARLAENAKKPGGLLLNP
ncbi:MAG TPA: hypothetical protein VG407_03565 [Caulobacteraceae bacterium]|jgi:hypothetical protein|nr:hypothetical protein [Caulobacteraceae bacterium]